MELKTRKRKAVIPAAVPKIEPTHQIPWKSVECKGDVRKYYANMRLDPLLPASPFKLAYYLTVTPAFQKLLSDSGRSRYSPTKKVVKIPARSGDGQSTLLSHKVAH